jgi:hypothetical protein
MDTLNDAVLLVELGEKAGLPGEYASASGSGMVIVNEKGNRYIGVRRHPVRPRWKSGLLQAATPVEPLVCYTRFRDRSPQGADIHRR